MPITRSLLARAALLCVLLATTAAGAERGANYPFDTSGQLLAEALKQYAQTTNQSLIFTEDLVAGVEANVLKGHYTADIALAELLKGTGLIAVKNAAGALQIRRAESSKSTANVHSTSSKVGTEQDAATPLRSDLRLAQAESAEKTNQPSGKEGEPQDKSLEEIIVTATKRAESLQDIPLSVTALNEQLLIKAGAVDLIDYATRVPNLSFGATADNALGANSIQIRGVAGGGGGIAGGGTTGFYIDDVPVPESMNPKVMDIARIEVLRGPQGSLYGARSMGGTVRLITKRADPTAREFNVHAALSGVADGGQDYAADAAVNIPIAGNAAFRGNAYYLRESGVHDILIDSPLVAGDEVTLHNPDEGEYWGFQGMVTWNLAENFTAEPRFIYQNSHIDWLQWSDGAPDNFTNTRVSGLADPNDMEWSISSLTLTWDTDWGRLTSASGYFNHDIDAREEMSEAINYLSIVLGGNPDYYPPGGVLLERNQRIRQLTEELRFTSKFEGRTQITAGAFYSDNTSKSSAPCVFTIGFNAASGFPFGTDCFISSFFDVDTEELALFGELDFAVLENLTVTAGGRYFENSLDISNTRTGWVVDFGAPSIPTLFGSQKEHGFNPKAAVKLEATDDWTVYASAAKGFRIGGANVARVPLELCGEDLAAIGISGSPDSYDSDSLWNYEAGSKSTHFDRRLSVNAAAFFIVWKDIIQNTALPCGFGFTNNTGEAQLKGFELEVAARPVDELTVNLGVGYTDAKVTDPGAASGVSKGDPIPQVPQWMFSSDMEYRFPVNAHEGYFFVSYRWIDESISVNAGRSTPRVRDAYDLLDARLGMTFGKIDVSLFGKNLTNRHANLSDNLQLALEVPGRPRYVTNRPRTIGIDFRYGF